MPPTAARTVSYVLVNQGAHRSPWQLSVLNAHNNKLSFWQITDHVFIFLSIIYFTLQWVIEGVGEKKLAI